VLAVIRELVGRFAQRAGKHFARGFVNPEAPAELTGIVPPHRLFLGQRNHLERARGRSRGSLHEELDPGRDVHTGVQVTPLESKPAADIDHEQARVRSNCGGEVTGVPRERWCIPGEAQGQAAAHVYERQRPTRDARSRFDRVAGLPWSPEQVSASHEHSFVCVRAEARVRRVLSRRRAGPGFVIREAGDRAFRPLGR
jgi:hypothetical protein